jgi:hypothetical protein
LIAAVVVGVPVAIGAITGGADAGPRNLLTADQQTFERGLGGWNGQQGTSVRRTDDASYEGRRSLRISASRLTSGTSSTMVASTPTGLSAVAVRAGASYSGSVQLRSGSRSQRAVQCELAWYRSNGSLLTRTVGATQPETSGQWTQARCAGVAPTAAARAALRIIVTGASSFEKHYADDAWLTEDAPPPTTSTSAAPTTAAPTTAPTVTTTVPQVPAFAAHINAGSSSDLAAPDGTRFVADRNYFGGSVMETGPAPIGGTNNDALYQKHRWGMAGYAVPVPAAGTYNVRLHFSEPVFSAPGWRVFDVTAEGTLMLDNLDVAAAVGANNALVRSFAVNVSDGVLNLGFPPVVEDPMVSGVEVLSAGASSPAPSPPTTAPPTTAPPTTTPPTTAPPTTVPRTTTPPTTAPPTPPPTSSGVCTGRDAAGGVPADRFPGAACTGVLPGTGLTPVSASGLFFITQDNSVWERVEFNSEVCVQADNVTIRNSRANRPIRAANPFGYYGCGADGGARNLTLIDVEVNAQSPTTAAVEGGVYGGGISCVRCNLHHAGAGINGRNYSLVDTFVHSLIGASADAHLDGIQAFGGDVVVRHSNIVANVVAGSGGVSCAVCLYTHLDWGPMDDVLIEHTRVEAQAAGQCIFAGDSAEQNPTNIRFVDVDIYGACATAVSSWLRHPTNVWSDVTYQGWPMAEPS